MNCVLGQLFEGKEGAFIFKIEQCKVCRIYVKSYTPYEERLNKCTGYPKAKVEPGDHDWGHDQLLHSSSCLKCGELVGDAMMDIWDQQTEPFTNPGKIGHLYACREDEFAWVRAAKAQAIVEKLQEMLKELLDIHDPS